MRKLERGRRDNTHIPCALLRLSRHGSRPPAWLPLPRLPLLVLVLDETAWPSVLLTLFPLSTPVARASVTVPVITELPKFEISIYHSRTFHHWRLLLFLKHAIRNFWTSASAVELAT